MGGGDQERRPWSWIGVGYAQSKGYAFSKEGYQQVLEPEISKRVLSEFEMEMVAGGVYFYVLEAGGETLRRKMALLK